MHVLHCTPRQILLGRLIQGGVRRAGHAARVNGDAGKLFIAKPVEKRT